MRISNILITERASSVLRRERERFRPRAGDAFALVYVSSYTNPDGTTVEGFQPGYMAAPLPVGDLGPNCLQARVADGIEFYFLPRFRWRGDAWYLVDLVGALFSIGPVPRGGGPPV